MKSRKLILRNSFPPIGEVSIMPDEVLQAGDKIYYKNKFLAFTNLWSGIKAGIFNSYGYSFTRIQRK